MSYIANQKRYSDIKYSKCVGRGPMSFAIIDEIELG